MNHHRLELPGKGPEDVVADSKGRLYCGVEDGRILRIEPGSGEVEELGRVEGRPLGLEIVNDEKLLICDSPNGLIELDLASGASNVLVSADGDEKLIFCSNVIAAPTGDVFFTVSSMRYPFGHWPRDFAEGIPTGRVYHLKRDKTLHCLRKDLFFANGLVLSKDPCRIFVAETARMRLHALSLLSEKAGCCNVIADLPGFPDNLGSDHENGIIWTSLVSEPNQMLDIIHKLPYAMRWAVARLPESLQPKPTRIAWVVGCDEAGRTVFEFKTKDGSFSKITSVCRVGQSLWCGSLEETALLRIDLPDTI